ncbi:MAG: hypothetical protein GXO82_09270 [Chlorobi bacterium]|nr:hypothetical protein [Chlorobiota bacterium]
MKIMRIAPVLALIFLVAGTRANAQEVSSSDGVEWDLSGRIQLQHTYNTDVEADASSTNNGFRIRRARLQTKVTLNSWVQAKIQIDVRDNKPRLKDAEGKLKLSKNVAFRFGQFKVPVWREELRSSSKLLLVERSAAAEFLVDELLSARHIGVELNGKLIKGLSFAVNYSNGAGEGGREDAGRSKSMSVNNGKMVSGRLNASLGKHFQVGVSGVSNSLGVNIDSLDNRGTISTLAADFGVYLPLGLDVEGGLALGRKSAELTGNADQSFVLADITGRWRHRFNKENTSLVDVVEFAAGVSYVEPNSDLANDESIHLRFGPAVYFGKHARFQVNGELAMPTAEGASSIFLVRSQFTLNL